MSELPPIWQKRLTAEPVNVEECRAAGASFGGVNRSLSRFSFEELLVKRLEALEGLFGSTVGLTEECLAAFDHAAWDAWEAPKE